MHDFYHMEYSDLRDIFNADCFPRDQRVLKEVGEGDVIVQSCPIDKGGIDSYLVMRIDPNRNDPFPYFNNGAPYHLKCICDYIVFINVDAKIYVMLMELKSGSGTALTQLENSECFWNFLQKSAERKGIDISNVAGVIKVKLHQPQKACTKMEIPRYDKGSDVVIYHWAKCRLKRILQLALQNR